MGLGVRDGGREDGQINETQNRHTANLWPDLRRSRASWLTSGTVRLLVDRKDRENPVFAGDSPNGADANNLSSTHRIAGRANRRTGDANAEV